MAREVPLAVFGAAGRMGKAVIDAIEDDAEAVLGAAIERDGHELIGQQAADGVAYASPRTADLGGCSAMIAFPVASGVADALSCALTAKVPLVIGTTGLSDGARQNVEAASASIPLLAEPNLSLGVSVMRKLVASAAARLPGWDAEIFEIHHRNKVDAPSGTALRLHEVLVGARGGKGKACTDRSNRREKRPDDEIGHSVMRAGDVIGEHTVLLAGTGERLEITHKATSRSTFATGAVFAAKALVGKEPGLYGLDGLLFSDGGGP